MKNSVLYLYSNMDKSSQILLFLIILVALMLISIFVINIITKKKNENILGLTNKSKFSSKSDIKPTVNMKNPEKKLQKNVQKVENKKIQVKENNIKEKKIKEEIIESIDEKIEPRHAKKEMVQENKIQEQKIQEQKLQKPKEEVKEEVVRVKKRTSIDDIASLMENNNKVNKPIDLTKFEEDQEENAIISYDELVKRAGAKKIIYKCEDTTDVINNAEEKISVEPNNTVKEEKKFKASQVISPIFGIQKEEPVKDEVLESFIDLEEFTDDNKNTNNDSDENFLSKLKEFRSTLD